MTTAKILYKVRLADTASKTVTVVQTGKKIELKLEGFGKNVVVQANGGGTETCRTIISNSTGGSKIVLSLPIPLPNTPCQMTPGTVLIVGDSYNVATGEKDVAKVSGNDGQFRKTVERLFGRIKVGGQ